MKQQLIDLLTKHEGQILHVYKCTAGFDTIGVGRNLQTKGLSASELNHFGFVGLSKEQVTQRLRLRGITLLESDMLLSNDIDEFTETLTRALPWLTSCPEIVQIVLIDMAFNMGVPGLLKFKNTLKMVQDGKYVEASKGMLQSLWAKQVKGRAVELSEMMASC